MLRSSIALLHQAFQALNSVNPTTGFGLMLSLRVGAEYGDGRHEGGLKPKVTPFVGHAEVSSPMTPQKCLTAHHLFGKIMHVNILQINVLQWKYLTLLYQALQISSSDE